MFASFNLGKNGAMIFSGNQVTYSRNTSVTEKKESKRRNKKCVVYPEYENLKEFTEDQFWLNTLDECKTGSVSKDLKFDGKSITCKKGKKVFSFVLEFFTKEKFQELKKFLFDSIGMQSPADEIKRGGYVVPSACGPLSFSKIKACSSKLRIAISHFITLLSKKENLSEYQIRGLESLIRNGIIAGAITEKNVIIENNLFVDINNLRFSREKKNFSLLFGLKTISKNSSSKELSTDYSSFSVFSESGGDENELINSSGEGYLISDWKDYIQKTFSKKKI